MRHNDQRLHSRAQSYHTPETVLNESACGTQSHTKGIDYLDDVENSDGFREGKDLVQARKERVEQPLEDHHIPARVDELVVHDVLMHVRPFEQDRVRADLAQLRHDILQAHVVDLFTVFPRAAQRRAERDDSASAGG